MKRSICFFHPPGGGESHRKAILLKAATVYFLAWIRNRKEKKGKQEHVCILTHMQTYLINKKQKESDLSLKICKGTQGKVQEQNAHITDCTPKCVFFFTGKASVPGLSDRLVYLKMICKGLNLKGSVLLWLSGHYHFSSPCSGWKGLKPRTTVVWHP